MPAQIQLPDNESILQDKRDSSLEHYDYDLVFGVTLYAINSQLGRYIDKVAGKMPASPIFIIKNESGSLSPASGPVAGQLCALDLFSIPTDEAKRTDAQCAAWSKACGELGFAYGYEAAPGFLKTSDKTRTIDFDAQQITNNSKVTYRPFFKKFVLLENQPDASGKAVIFRSEQASNSPWVFQVQVNLGISDIPLDSLPADIREKMRGMDIGRLFSVNQLFLNTKSFVVTGRPEVFEQGPGQRKDSLDIFLGNFFEESGRAAGNFALGYSLPSNPSPEQKQYLVTPVDFRYYISPHLDEHGNPTADKGLYTLNYIAICSKRPFPELRPLRWNWVDEDQKSRIQGVLAIRQANVQRFAAGQFSEMIKGLLLKPKIDVHMSKRTATLGFNFEKTNTSCDFRPDSFHYNCPANHAYDKGVMADIGADANYVLTAKICHYTSKNKAIIEFIIEIAFSFSACCGFTFGSDEKGDGLPYHKIIICVLELDIGNGGQGGSNQFGKLITTPSVTRLDLETSLNVNGLKSIHCLKDSIGNAQNWLSDYINNIVNDFEKEFKNRFNGQTCSWFIPGSESAAYSDTSFSMGGDLVFNMSFTN